MPPPRRAPSRGNAQSPLTPVVQGLHVSPEGMSDDVFREVGPGETAEYTYIIPSDHPVGTFWYHPHVHGSSSLQQGGGMAGALIVGPADPATYLPAEIAAMGEAVVVFQHLCFHTEGKYHDANPYINHMMVYAFSDDAVDPEPSSRFAQDPNGYYLTNGAYRPTIAMRPGQFTLFKLVAASLSAFLELAIVPHTRGDADAAGVGAPPPAPAAAARTPCDMYVVAKDGIWVDVAYQHQRPLLVPGSRVDVAVRCPAAGAYDLVSTPDAPYHSQLEQNTVVYTGVLATLAVAGSTVSMKPPGTLPRPPDYMADLTTAKVVTGTFDIQFFTPGGPMSFGPPYPDFQINRASWSNKGTFVRNLTLGRVEQWQVGIDGDETASSNHPFHLHVNPFQIVGIGAANASSMLDIQLGEWRDTVPIPKYDSLTIRFRPDRFGGHALFHCHMVPHTDLGMAAVAHIAGTTPAAAV